MITAELKERGISGSIGSRRYQYVVIGTEGDAEMSEVDALQAVGGSGTGVAPATVDDGAGGLLVGTDISIDEFIQTPTQTIAIITAEYGSPEDSSRLGGDGTTPLAEATYEFSYQAPSDHIFYALSTTTFGSNAPDFGNKIRCKYDGQDLIHEGIDLPGGNTTNVWRITAPKGFMTTQYEALVEGMMGAVNSQPFKSRPAGTMRFVQCQSSVSTGGTLNIAWGFQYSPNRTNLTIGGISGVNIGGHQIWWTLDEKELDLTAKRMVLAPRAVYVQTVHQEVDLNNLGF